ncbi:MAG: hypothetical protein KHW88_03595 [Lachnospiraceae bacterium]|nr:hypothetical protein [Lachnospiraceae bacterium]MEE0512645.1 hypothetical protein [Lachnospiraceae bacterium]
MAIKPILFNTEMVRANLDGRKTCTRRLVKPQPDEKHTYPLGFVTDSTEKKEVGCFGFGIEEYGGSIKYVKPPYQPEDILYVRETWNKGLERYMYRADYSDTEKFYQGGKEIEMKWYPSIHMPKEAARIWLKCTDVRVERLQEITESGAKAEGVRGYTKDGNLYKYAVTDDWWIDYHNKHKEIVTGTWWQDMPRTAKDAFSYLWNSTIKKSDLDLYGWNANPWVWTIEYERCEKPEGV